MSTFPIDFTNEAGRHFLNRHEWEPVQCKALVQRTLATLSAKSYRIVRLSAARTGTVYIEVGRGDWDTRYEMFGDGDQISLRIADHACVAGAFSHDGRTDSYTRPDIEVTDDTDLAEALEEAFDEL